MKIITRCIDGKDRTYPLPTLPEHRGAGWATFGDTMVAILLDKKEPVRIIRGSICSSKSSHEGVSNITEFVMWGNEPFNEESDNADDALSRTFKVTDPFFLRESEADFLKDPVAGKAWFCKGFLSPEVAEMISASLSKKVI